MGTGGDSLPAGCAFLRHEAENPYNLPPKVGMQMRTVDTAAQVETLFSSKILHWVRQ